MAEERLSRYVINEHGTVGNTLEETVPRWPERVKAPEGAPNIVYIVLDDLGYAQLGSYGSTIETPNIDSLAAGGLRYTNSHVTAICSPTRASLLTGRNPHSIGMSCVSDLNTGFAHTRGKVHKEAGLISEILKDNGYSTFISGKWHLAPYEDQSAAGPFDNWPLGRGFEHFYGFLGGGTNQFSPVLHQDNHEVMAPKSAADGYHLTEDLTDKAIEYVRDQKAAAPDKPFFLYLAYGATHDPHHAPKEYIDKYKGKFDEGWDIIREQWFERQKQLGLIPANTKLPPPNPGVQAWASLSEDQRRLYAKSQEAFAGFLDHTDYHIGRVLQFLQEIGQFENTVIVLISDNGASGEGGEHGTWNMLKSYNGIKETLEVNLPHLEDWGGPATNNHYPTGWAQAGNSPLKFYKTWLHAGGVKTPLILHYPKGIKDGGGIRQQYHHAIDVMPTILELIGIEPPAFINGVEQLPLQGVSLVYSFDDAKAETHRSTQYYEMIGHRAIYNEGWKAVTNHRAGSRYEDDIWELYHLDEDFSETTDLAGEHPDKLNELIEKWWIEAEKYGVLPLDGRSLWGRLKDSFGDEGNVPVAAKRTFFNGTRFLRGPDLRNRSFTFDAVVERVSADDEGVLVSEGSRFGGYSLYVKNNRLVFVYNYVGETYTVISSDTEVPLGKSVLTFEYAKQGEHTGIGKLYINGDQVGEEVIPKTGAIMFGGGGGFTVGKNLISPITPEYEAPFEFKGRLSKLELYADNGARDIAADLAAEIASE
ncbi:arylsulfatase [Paenibacillus nasutitermitis]|uniref:Arylsulfatase n=1 Tax=Paenibacillus nasutitermitis TaxID=1652958 RepID=A0A916YT14_9BACL|nr:arylsulfatase [Paenibacillus nasutitermitis]GGD58618.1 arylsulfatase [Paenibacillus nasutitermitis]